jgi:hypothetical protein
MTGLQFASSQPRRHLGILLYGQEGCGKSTGALTAPGPLVYCNADRPGAIRFGRRLYSQKAILELPVDGRVPLEALYIALRGHEYDEVQTVVIDSLGRLYDVVLAEIAKDDRHPTLPERGDANTWIERYVLALLDLNVHVVLVAHDNPVVVSGSEEKGTAEIELFPFTGTNSAGLAKKIMRALDIVAYCGRRDLTEERAVAFQQTAKDGKALSSAVDLERGEEFVAQLYVAGGRRVKETTGVLGRVELLDIGDWVERINNVYLPTNTQEKAA